MLNNEKYRPIQNGKEFIKLVKNKNYPKLIFRLKGSKTIKETEVIGFIDNVESNVHAVMFKNSILIYDYDFLFNQCEFYDIKTEKWKVFGVEE